MKKARFVWGENGPKLQTGELSHRSFQHEMARYSSNVGNKLQMMIKIGKVCGLHRILTPRSHLLRAKPCGADSARNFRAHPRVGAEQRTHSGDETGTGFDHKSTERKRQRYRTLLIVLIYNAANASIIVFKYP